MNRRPNPAFSEFESGVRPSLPTPPAKKVLIVMMPFATPEFPGLGPTLIRSILIAAQIPTDIVYGNLVFSKLIGADPFVENALSELPICEIAFTPYYFGTDVRKAAEELRQYVLELAVMPEAHTAARFIDIVENAGRCVESMFRSIAWDDYDVVGFSLLMGQTVASLALAKRIKAAFPHITIIVGGAHTQAPMGDEMLRSFPEFDYVLPGEADGVVAPFVEELRRGTRKDFTTGGVLYRDDQGKVRSSGDAEPFLKLDSLPVPDFSEFFAQMEALGLNHIQPYMPLETSRGCWWGEKHHCTFCGIDDKIMVYRSKTPSRVLHEILALSQKHSYTEFFTVDSIINFKFFNELLPTLGELRRKRAWDFTFFFESKSNINRDQARRFRDGGVNHVQPGLETFSDHVLELMDKGTTGARQIQCLKLLAENNITADWNLIFCNPGETEEDYREIIDVIPFIHHLPPLHAGGLIPMQINRYAPYYNQPGHYGIKNIRPKRYYKLIYPDPSVDLDRLSFYFDCDFDIPPTQKLQTCYRTLEERLDEWRACYVPDALLQSRGPGFVKIVDRRSWEPNVPTPTSAERVYVLDGVAADIFIYCDDIRTMAQVSHAFGYACDAEQIRGFIDHLVALRLIYRSPSDQVISLPILREAEERFRFVPGQPVKAPTTRLSLAMAHPAHSDEPIRDVGELALLAHERSVGQTIKAGKQVLLASVRSGRGPVSEPRYAIRADERPAATIIAEIEDITRNTQSLRLQLEGLHLGRDRHVELLQALASRRSESFFGFEFGCDVTQVPGTALSGLMREAGISSSTLRLLPSAEDQSPISANLRRVEAVKNLSGAGIEVIWDLDERTVLLDEEDYGSMVAICESARHLPPPRLPAGDRTSRTADMVIRWSEQHKPRTLTYARGPGFMRIFDRRLEVGHWRFVCLGDAQADVLLCCDTVKDVATLLAELPDVKESELRRFLNGLVDQEVMCRGPLDQYLALPIRRSIEERWASGDY
jgi:ribosomal peptide maturation radical SAM protein 1